MDPDQCLSDLIDAAHAGQAYKLVVLATDLASWLRSGGFAPEDPRPMPNVPLDAPPGATHVWATPAGAEYLRVVRGAVAEN